MPGEVERPVSAARNGWATDAELRALFLGIGAHDASRRRRPLRDRGELRQQRRKMGATAVSENLGRLLVHLRGRSTNRKPAPSRVRPASWRVPSAGIAARNCARFRSSSLACDLGPALEIGKGADQRLIELVVARGAHIMAVHVFELGKVEARGRAADRRQIEGGDQLVGR